MSHALVTIIAPLHPDSLDNAITAIDALGNPANKVLAEELRKLDEGRGIHFASLHALPSYTEGKAHIILEMSADGDERWAVQWIARLAGPQLTSVFKLATDWQGDLTKYLLAHVRRAGFGIGAQPGLAHVGTPGMTVGRIKAEAALFSDISQILAHQGGGISALDRLEDVRSTLRASGKEPLTPPEPPPPSSQSETLEAIGAGVTVFAREFLRPWLLALLLLWLTLLALQWYEAAELREWVKVAGATAIPPSDRWWAAARQWPGFMFALHMLGVALSLTLKLLLGFAALALVVAAALYLQLRRQEAQDWVSNRSPDVEVLREIEAQENQPGYAHNHMISITQRKHGWLRYFTLRLIFLAIGTAGPRLYKAGYLGSIGTIHFARWFTVPGTRDLIFVSNYGGSWEAYIEDFVTLAHNGLTGVWSNTVGFPKTNNLINDGATDGERFKRFARQSMQPTKFWFSAYPGFDTDMIRANADISFGLATAMTEDAATTWLSHFGSTRRPDIKLVTTEIQSLVFGGLGFLPSSAATFWALPDDQTAARAWLADLKPIIAWSDGRRLLEDPRRAIVQLGLSAEGLDALGLPTEALETFPAAFRSGMRNRPRILGDMGLSASQHWWWREPGHAAVFIYGDDANARDELLRRLDELAQVHGMTLLNRVLMKEVKKRKLADTKADAIASGNAQHDAPRHDQEPFGFADGISQPIIQGTYKAERAEANPLHIVAPGEFVLGYPDGRGNVPPGPVMNPIHDPSNALPLCSKKTIAGGNDVNFDRDLGRNGTFLVVRQLEQDVGGFDDYCRKESESLSKRSRLGPPYHVTPKFIAAKMIGRWQNGAPLVRSPYTMASNKAIVEENAFLLGFEDPEGLRCPFGAHIRRANPRDSLNPGSTEQVSISNRHRLLRVGRSYEPNEGQKPGILFMCLNADLERQFEFVQQTWLNGNVISLACPTNLSGESDPLSSSEQARSGFTIPSRDGPVKLEPLPSFVTMRGGGYYFMPGKRLVSYLSEP
ncbi:Dyp-type peroxidase [Sphingomonas sp. TWP1-3-1]|uniref:Dyp-type peroxidase n=1 Tax=Sphingomonas sp. TWP1-3-1 TaxID=2804612 RepID=UPI003CE82664